jgi:hypothetical protein
MHASNASTCTIAFKNDRDMSKAFKYILDTHGKFSGVSKHSIMVTKDVCENIEKIVNVKHVT